MRVFEAAFSALGEGSAEGAGYDDLGDGSQYDVEMTGECVFSWKEVEVMLQLLSHRSKTRCVTHVISLLLQQSLLSLGARSTRASASTHEMALDLRKAFLNYTTVSNLIHHSPTPHRMLPPNIPLFGAWLAILSSIVDIEAV